MYKNMNMITKKYYWSNCPLKKKALKDNENL